jgi:ATP-dependent exoDNAse (exonuclease V) beta subunit
MHRALELMVLRRNDDEFIDYDEKTLSDSVNQAINESCDKIDYEKDYQKYYDFIKSVVYYSKEYFKNSKIMLNSTTVEPEMEFSIFDDEIKSKYKTEDDDTPIYLTGSMDLVIIYDDSALIIDYKSDAKGFKDTKQFSDHLKNQYKPQLDIYKKALNDMYNIDENKIQTKILYFYDYNGKNIVKVGEVDL